MANKLKLFGENSMFLQLFLTVLKKKKKSETTNNSFYTDMLVFPNYLGNRKKNYLFGTLSRFKML